MDVAIATYSELPNLQEHDLHLAPAFARLGLVAQPVRWDEPGFDWSKPRLTVIRSTWDYHHRLDEFLAWVEHVGKVGRIANPPEVVRWNSHKRYLAEFERRGVPVAETEWVRHGARANLAELLARRGWKKAAVKLSVSAGALGVFLTTTEKAAADQVRFEQALAKADVLVQPFLPDLAENGEISAVFFDGELAYGIHRPAGLDAPGVVPPSTKAVPVDAEHRAVAERALAACPPGALYARIDMARDLSGKLAVMEAELIEPALYFGLVEGSADRYAAAAAKRLRPG